MAKYQSPEGFEYDPNTGLYFNQVMAVDENGHNVRVITWFNADTGEYKRDIYPENKNTDPDTNTKGPKRSSILRIAIPAILVIAVLVFLGIKFLGDRSGDSKDAAGTPDESGYTDSIGDEEAEAFSDDVMEDTGETDSTPSAWDIDYINPGGDLTTMWNTHDGRDFIGFSYTTVYADDDYVYALIPENSDFSFGPGYGGRLDLGGCSGIPRGEIIRFNKNPNEDQNVEYSICNNVFTYTILGDYIYYSTGGYDEDELWYVQKNKNTGEEQKLFRDEYSFILPHDGKLFFWFSKNNRADLMIFDPATGEKMVEDLSSVNFKKIFKESYEYSGKSIDENNEFGMTSAFGFYDGDYVFEGLEDDYLFAVIIDSDTHEKIKVLENYAVPFTPSKAEVSGPFDPAMLERYSEGINGARLQVIRELGNNLCVCKSDTAATGGLNFTFQGDTDEYHFEYFHDYAFKSDHVYLHYFANDDNRTPTTTLLIAREGDHKSFSSADGNLPDGRLEITGDNYFVGYRDYWIVYNKHAFYFDRNSISITKVIDF